MPPNVTSVTPAPQATGISLSTAVTATFNRDMDSTSINSSTFFMLDPVQNVVPATVSYNATTRVATLVPLASPLSTVTSYKVALLGGEDGARDASGIELLFDITWTFTTAVADPYGDGPGGPILVLTDDAEPFSRYYAEILLTEGLNTFAIRDVATLTPSLLGSYEVVVPGAVPAYASPGNFACELGQCGRQPDRHASGPDLAGLLGLVEHRRDAVGRLPPGEHGGADPARGHRRRDRSVPWHRRSL